MTKECANCKEIIKRGMLCAACAAVLDIRTHFTAYAYNPRELSALLEDLERHNVDTAQRLLDLATSRGATLMQTLGRKCVEAEVRAGVGVFHRALRYLRKGGDADEGELAGIISGVVRSATAPKQAFTPQETPE
jgi:hypothetical protein